jgi:outer membrane lipopolysaccharide assembly protein LptE/RlpB
MRTARLGRAACALVIAMTLLGAGCGYKTAGHTSKLPSSLHVIAIPSFINQTQTYKIETTLTNAVVREFNTRTNYKVVSETSDSADATLRGTVVSVQLAPVTYDSQSGQASTALVTVNMKVTLTARDGRVLFENPNYIFREQYQVSNQVSSFFEEENPALDRLSRDFARTLVSNVLEGF